MTNDVPPEDASDAIEAMARDLRDAQRLPVEVAPPEAPALGEVDVFTDEHAVTVTAEARNLVPSDVQVSIVEGHLLIHVGHGPATLWKDLPLPAAVVEENAYATFRNGVLDVVLPRRR